MNKKLYFLYKTKILFYLTHSLGFKLQLIFSIRVCKSTNLVRLIYQVNNNPLKKKKYSLKSDFSLIIFFKYKKVFKLAIILADFKFPLKTEFKSQSNIGLTFSSTHCFKTLSKGKTHLPGHLTTLRSF